LVAASGLGARVLRVIYNKGWNEAVVITVVPTRKRIGAPGEVQV